MFTFGARRRQRFAADFSASQAPAGAKRKRQIREFSVSPAVFEF
jgi:hypothetical protein